MFKALFLEGFARPLDGVRLILRVLLEKYRAAGGERRMKCGVQRIVTREQRAAALLLDSGEEITADHVISSIGAPETDRLLQVERLAPKALERVESNAFHPEPGRLSFIETITVLNRQPTALGWGDDTIVFFNDSPRFDYARPDEQVDTRSGVICLPNNFAYPAGEQLDEGFLRITCLANYDRWATLPEETYRADKQRWFAAAQRSARRFLPAVADDVLAKTTVTTDMFTPRTITKFTGHLQGAIYEIGRAHV